MGKGQGYKPMVPQPGAWSILTIADKLLHRSRRKGYSKALSDEALREYEPRLIDHIDIFHNRVTPARTSDGWSSPSNLAIDGMFLTLDVMCDFGFGQTENFQLNHDQKFVTDAFRNYSIRMGVYAQFPALATLKLEIFVALCGFGVGIWRKFTAWRSKFTALVVGKIDRAHIGQFAHIRALKDPYSGNTISDLELWAEGCFLMLAGSETTAIAVSAVFFYLAKFPEVYARLAGEIRDTFDNLEEVKSGQKLLSCSYLTAVITEAMRMSPPIPGIPFREVESDGAHVDGQWIPGGYTVGTGVYALHHNPEYFSEPYSFRPKRWLDGTCQDGAAAAQDVRKARSALMTFSLGPRGCLGRSMAFQQLNLIVARTIFAYDFRLTPGELGKVGEGDPKNPLRHCPDEFQLYAHITSYCDGPWLQYRRRESNPQKS
ncbi:MAG: hypothetical protein M1820_005272 [Bogoriella megaspora]|nr:MAG: hypothetical protein M1820_005272 [Bogoriella megaspora]